MIGEAAALGASLCWAVGSHLFGRVGRRGDVALPDAINLGKCLTALILFAAAGLALAGHVVPHLPPRAVGWLVASGVVGLALGDGAYFRAMASIGVRRALLLLSTAPVFAAVGGAIFLGERLRVVDAAAILAVVGGVALVVREQTSGLKEQALTAVPVSGILFGVASGLGQATGSLMTRAGMAGDVSALDAALVRLPAGLVGIVLLAALSGRLGGFVRALRKPGVAGAVASSATVGTFVGLWLSQLAIARASSTAIAATLLATSPIFALPLGRVLADERITARAVTGTVVACAGTMLLTLTPR